MGKNNKKRRIRPQSQEPPASCATTAPSSQNSNGSISGGNVKDNNNNKKNKNEDQHQKKKPSNSPSPKKGQQPQQQQRKNANNNKNDKKKPSKTTTSTTTSTSTSNPLYTKQQAFLNQLRSDTERNELFSPKITPERRAELWMQQADLGESLVNDYAWATPNETAIRICKEFSPLLEIGCGANAYWCQVLKKASVDIVGHDSNAQAGGKIEEQQEQPASSNKKKKKSKKNNKKEQKVENVLQKVLQDHPDRTLFLCYPDDEDEEPEEGGIPTAPLFDEDGNPAPPPSMAAQCLEHYTGQYIIHVGELFLDANYSIDQAPWGRSSSPEFQQRLAVEFHCLLKVQLPNWLHVRDSISVWKRSEQTSIVFGGQDDDDEDDEKFNDEDDDIDEVIYRHIPVEERLPMDIAAPCLAHLLPANNKKESANNKVLTKKEKPASSSNKKASSKPAPSKQDDDDEDDEDYGSDDANDDDEEEDDDANDDDDDDDDSDRADDDDDDDDEPMEQPPKKKKKKGPLNLGVSQKVQKKIKKALKIGGKSSSPW
jgi:hypothetical protein